MAVVIPLKGGGRTLGGALDYAEKNKLDGTKNLTRGVNCSDDKKTALAEMRATKKLWNQNDGRQYKGYVISFVTGELTPEQALDHAEKFCQTTFPTNESFLGCHIDTDNIHIHIIVNSVDFENGQKIHLPKSELENFRDISDNICREMGLSVIEPRTIPLEEGTIRTKSRHEYEVLKNAIEKNDGSSHKLNLRNDIKTTLNKVAGQGFGAFKTEMERLGIDYKMSGDKKPKILFRYKNAPEGTRFIDGANLAKTFSDPSLTRESITEIVKNGLEKTPIEPHVAKYREYASRGMDDAAIIKQMHVVDKIPTKDIANAVFNNSPKAPKLSNESMKYTRDLIKRAERTAETGHRKTTGGGMVAGMGGSNRSRNESTVNSVLSTLLPQEPRNATLTVGDTRGGDELDLSGMTVEQRKAAIAEMNCDND